MTKRKTAAEHLEREARREKAVYMGERSYSYQEGVVLKAIQSAMDAAHDAAIGEALRVIITRGHADKLSNIDNPNRVMLARYGAWLDAEDAIRALKSKGGG